MMIGRFFSFVASILAPMVAGAKARRDARLAWMSWTDEDRATERTAWKALAETERQLAQSDAGWRAAEEALRWYADHDHYARTERVDGLVQLQRPIDLDGGARARKVVGV